MTEQVKRERELSKSYYVVIFILGLLSVGLICNTLVDWKLKQINEELATAKANSPMIKIIDQKALAGYFQSQEYDIPTQLEYMDILKVLLDKSRIIAVNASAVQFDTDNYNLRINSIEELRLQLQKLGIDNPRNTKEAEYLERAAKQKELTRRLFAG
ncbi:hypothetical protein [Shewanella colwelliana]|nr:hypothetical protein [Shewanella colwelliana]